MTLYQKSRRPFRQKGKFYRLNFFITAPNVRVLDATGKQVGVFTRDEAIRRARQENLDLVEIAPAANPPVCKIIDFKKFKYLESKKERESKKQNKNLELKQIMLSPFIGDHDFVVKLQKAKEFLKEGHRLKVTVKFTRRLFSKKEFGFEVIKKLVTNVEGLGQIEKPPHFEGTSLTAQINPGKRSNNETKNQKVAGQTVQVNEKRESDAPQAIRQASAVLQKQEAKT